MLFCVLEHLQMSEKNALEHIENIWKNTNLLF